MKNFLIVLVTIMTFVVSANAQLKTLVEQNITWSTAGANVTIIGPIDISDCWKPLTAVGTALAGSDSAYVFTWNSTVCSSADSGDVDIAMGVSNQFWKPSKGFNGTGNWDSLAVPNGTEHVKWFGADASGVLCSVANSDTIVIHAAATSQANQTEGQLRGRMVSTTPKKYAYFRYTAGAANSASNKLRHTVVAAINK